jgi:hypothetical protein
MDAQNAISADLSAEQVAQAQAQLQGLETSLLPFLLDLSQEERKELLRVDARLVENAPHIIAMLESFPQHFGAATHDLPALRQDLKLIEGLAVIAQDLERLQKKIADTLMAARSDVGRSVLTAYALAKHLPAPPVGLDAKLEPLRKSLARKGRAPSEP